MAERAPWRPTLPRSVQDRYEGTPQPETNRGTRRVEWIGERSPIDDFVRLKMAHGAYTPLQLKALRRIAARAVKRNGGMRRRMGELQADGLGAVYEWGPDVGYVREMPHRDLDRLKSLPCADEFVDLDDPDDVARRNRPLAVRDATIRVVGKEVMTARGEFREIGLGG